MMFARLITSCVILLCSAAAVAAQPAVFIVRHAERADAGTAAAKMTGADPDLSDAGRERARSLVTLLKDAKIGAVFTSEYKRTRQTAELVAKGAAVDIVQTPSKDTQAWLAKVTASTGNVLVVGHSNSIPELIKALGIPEPVAIGEDEYDNLFVVVRGTKPMLLRLHYR